MLLLFVLRLLCAYFPTKWDEIAQLTPSAESILKTSNGWLKHHDSKVYVDVFGDFSVFTINFYTKHSIMSIEEELDAVLKILDSVHPTILALQGINDGLMPILRKVIKKTNHYAITSDSSSSIDLINGRKYFLPIIYDTNILEVRTQPKYYKNFIEEEVLYGAIVEFTGGRLGFFNFVNCDLFSGDSSVNAAWLANIIADISNASRIKREAVIISGTINNLESETIEVLNTVYNNTLMADAYSKNLPKTTLSEFTDIQDNVQRDFIFLRNLQRLYRIASSRIQTLWPYKTEHLPVYTIFSLIKRDEMVKSAKPDTKKVDLAKQINDETEKSILNHGINNAIKSKPPEIEDLKKSKDKNTEMKEPFIGKVEENPIIAMHS